MQIDKRQIDSNNYGRQTKFREIGKVEKQLDRQTNGSLKVIFINDNQISKQQLDCYIDYRSCFYRKALINRQKLD